MSPFEKVLPASGEIPSILKTLPSRPIEWILTTSFVLVIKEAREFRRMVFL